MVPLIERVAGELGALVSVDTYKPAVAHAAIAAGAAIVNDVERAARSRAGGRMRRHRRRARADAYARGAQGEAARSDARRAGRRRRQAVPARADLGGDGPRRLVRAADARPRSRFRQDPGADGRGAAGAVRSARARAAAAAGGLAQGFHRSDHRSGRRGSAWPERSRRSGTGSTPAPTCCASTTSPTSPITWRSRAALEGQAELRSDLQLAEDLRREPR